MAISHITTGSGQLGPTDQTSFTATFTGVAAGDYVLLCVVLDGTTSVAAPTGWTRYLSGSYGGGYMAVYGQERASAAGSQVWSTSTGRTGHYRWAAFRGAEYKNSGINAGTTGTTHTVTGVPAFDTGDWLVFGFGHDHASATAVDWSTPAGPTVIGEQVGSSTNTYTSSIMNYDSTPTSGAFTSNSSVSILPGEWYVTLAVPAVPPIDEVSSSASVIYVKSTGANEVEIMVETSIAQAQTVYVNSTRSVEGIVQTETVSVASTIYVKSTGSLDTVLFSSLTEVSIIYVKSTGDVLTGGLDEISAAASVLYARSVGTDTATFAVDNAERVIFGFSGGSDTTTLGEVIESLSTIYVALSGFDDFISTGPQIYYEVTQTMTIFASSTGMEGLSSTDTGNIATLYAYSHGADGLNAFDLIGSSVMGMTAEGQDTQVFEDNGLASLIYAATAGLETIIESDFSGSVLVYVQTTGIDRSKLGLPKFLLRSFLVSIEPYRDSLLMSEQPYSRSTLTLRQPMRESILA